MPDERACRVSARLVLGAVAVAAAAVAVATAPPARAALEPGALAQARLIRAELNTRYRSLAGRRLVVAEATPTGMVPSFTLIDDWLGAPRLVAAENGIYFSLCAVRPRCAYELRGSFLQPGAFLPRRLALELALRTFAATSVDLVVVSLPTARPLWVVFERADLVADLAEAGAQGVLGGRPTVPAAALRSRVLALTRPRLFAPLAILPPPHDTVYAVRLFPDKPHDDA
jgi:hypothetical protein